MNETEKYIDVAIPLPIEGVFTYSVPQSLLANAEFGRRVLVPFGKKKLAGFICGMRDVPPEVGEIKSIIDIPDETAYLTPNLWNLIRWIADYYLLPIGLVVKTALPSGLDRKSKPWINLTPEGCKIVLQNRQGGLTKALFGRKGSVLRGALEKSVGAEVVRQGLELGWWTCEERIAGPKRLREGSALLGNGSSDEVREMPVLTSEQEQGFAQLNAALAKGGFNPFLLFGVTGSGKTEVYLKLISELTGRSKRTLVLVPEIALTPQLARRFLNRFGSGVGIFHSGYSPAQRLQEWKRTLAGEFNVIIAARSGIFLPIPELGLIIVDEEHDASYKQEDGCFYNARDMALARAKLEGITVLLGSATPSFETFANAGRGKITRIDLRERHHGGKLPAVEIVDLKNRKSKTLLTPELVQAMREVLDRNEQVVLFLNRRGFDTFAQCTSCGNVFKCPNCDISLTHHKSSRQLRCHLCGYSKSAQPLCPVCLNEKLFFGGVGTQKIEEEIAELFPQARIERLDRDSTRKREDLETILNDFREKRIDILTGTQMIVKGHDFPGISLVGVLCGDLSLHFPDFRAAERTFQILAQVAGRTGREKDSGKVILQTFDPDHEAIKLAANHSYEEFFERDIVLRQELVYPPFGHLILIRIEGSNEKRVEAKAVRIGRAARFLKGESGEPMILGPAPSPRKKMLGRFRWQIILKSSSRRPVRDLCRQLGTEGHLKGNGLKIAVDVDPIDLL